MITFSRRSLATLATACALACVGTAAIGTTASHAQQKPKITASSLTLPMFNPLVWNIMKARGIDAKHGFELDAKPYPSISAFYAGFATGETDVRDRRADDPAEVLPGRRPAADFRHRLHARRPGDLRQGPQDQLARRPQGQAARRRHGRIAVPGAQDLRQRQGPRARQGHHRRQRQFRGRPRAARSRPGRGRAGDRAARQHHRAAESELEDDLQRRAGLEGDHRPGRLGNRAGDPRRRRQARAQRAQDAARRAPGRRQGDAQRDRRGRQDRGRDDQAAARHSQGRGRQQAPPT